MENVSGILAMNTLSDFNYIIKNLLQDAWNSFRLQDQ